MLSYNITKHIKISISIHNNLKKGRRVIGSRGSLWDSVWGPLLHKRTLFWKSDLIEVPHHHIQTHTNPQTIQNALLLLAFNRIRRRVVVIVNIIKYL